MKTKTSRKTLKPINKTEINITAAKGRPMLTWVGKRPLTRVTAFPAQHMETFDPRSQLGAKPSSPELWKDWPTAYPKCGLLFHGDNKEVLAHLLANGFRGKVNLIYIDPPFDSGADYVRHVQLRGAAGTAKIDGESYTLGEQIQYTDIWANDNYLQFMYERLLFLKELLAEKGSLWLHCDWHKGHHLRCLMDEVFGFNSFENEVIWYYYNKMATGTTRFSRAHDVLYCYSNGAPPFNPQEEKRDKPVKQIKRKYEEGVAVNVKDEKGRVIYQTRDVRRVDDVWRISCLQPADQTENTSFITQKPEELLKRILLSYSNTGDLILDCFLGSGTTAAVAQKLGRRWIGCDINKGAIQTTSKRLQTIIQQQVQAKTRSDKVPALPGMEVSGDGKLPAPAQFSFQVLRINDYDLQIQHNEAVNLACEHIGVERTHTDAYFDGSLGKSLVKIIPFGHPLTPLDLEEVKRELEARPDEDRPVTLVCLGMELAAKLWVEEWNRLRKGKDAVNHIELIELRSDPKYGKFIKHEPARAKVKISRKGDKVLIEIENFISPSIIERLEQQAGLLKPKIGDWRSMVDCVMIDSAYDGKVFNVTLSDVPEKKSDLVSGKYEVPASNEDRQVAIKIIDMLGEEVLVTQTFK